MARFSADALLVERGIFASREQARAAILAGEVRVGDVTIHKAGELLDECAPISVVQRKRFVSRGGDKLAGALAEFEIPVLGRSAVDVGASTGGFTDCLLQAGAVSVTAVDVGYGQLAWGLRNDARVRVFERTNIRYADPESLGAPFEIVVADVSFIALRTVLSSLITLMGPEADLIALVKPQFEAGKSRVGKRGVVRDPAVHEDVLRDVMEAICGAHLVVRGLAISSIRGPEGNIEFWVWAARQGEPADVDVSVLVARAHQTAGG